MAATRSAPQRNTAITTQRRGAGSRRATADSSDETLSAIGLSYAGGAATAIASSWVAEKTGLSKIAIALTEAGVGGLMAMKAQSPTLKRVGAGMGVAGAVLAALDWKQDSDAKRLAAARLVAANQLNAADTARAQVGAGDRRQAATDYYTRDELQQAVRDEVQQAIGDSNRQLAQLLRTELRNAGSSSEDWRDAGSSSEDWRDAGSSSEDWRDANDDDTRNAGSEDWNG